MTRIPLFPLSNALFPDGLLRLRVFEVRYLDMVRRCLAEAAPFGVVVLLGGREVRSPEGQEVLAEVGTLARIDDCQTPLPGLLTLRCTGTARFNLAAARQEKYGLWTGEASLLPADAPVDVPARLQPSADALGRFIAALQRDGTPAERWPLAAPFRLDEAGWVANRWAELLTLTPASKRDLLAQDDPAARLTHIQSMLAQRGLLSG